MERTGADWTTLLTPDGAAERMSMSAKTIYRMVDRREIDHVRIVRAIRNGNAAREAYVESVTFGVLPADEEFYGGRFHSGAA